MDKYTRKEVQALYEQYSRLDNDELFSLFNHELNKAITLRYSSLDENKKKLSVIHDELFEKIKHINEIVHKKIEKISQDPDGDYTNYNISCSCQDLILLTNQFQNLSRANQSINSQLTRLELIGHENSTIGDFLNYCYILSIESELSDIIKRVIKHPKTKKFIIDSILGLANYLTGKFAGIELAIPVLFITTLVNCLSSSESKGKSPFDFFDMGLKRGDVLEWIYNPSIKITVCSERKVLYNGKAMFLTTVTRDLISPNWHGKPRDFWLYNGKRLSDI